MERILEGPPRSLVLFRVVGGVGRRRGFDRLREYLRWTLQ